MEKVKRNNPIQLKVWISERESELLEQKIAKLGITKSEYIRNCILFGFPGRKTNFSDEEADRIAYEMNRIGNNVNQIARYVNKEHDAQQAEIEEVKNLVWNLHDVIMKLALE